MSALNEFQFEILPTDDAVDGVVFGIGADISVDDEGFHPGSTDWAVQDQPSSANGTMQFGRDLLQGPVWAWDAHINRDDTENAVETLSAFITAWRALHIRDIPGAKIPLRYRIAGRERRIYGRPGKIEASINNLLLSGFSPVTCDFQAVDGFTYDDVASGVTLTLGLTEEISSGGGGLVFPIVLPATSQVGTEQVASLAIGGDAPAYAIYRLNGPWTNPEVFTDSWRISLPDYEIPTGSYVEIDTRPWAQTVMLNGTASIGGEIGRRQKLYEAKLEPGDFDVHVGGFSSTGAATCQITWRNTWNSI